MNDIILSILILQLYHVNLRYSVLLDCYDVSEACEGLLRST